ncbi:MAG: hypothetical protein ACREIF_04080 [Chthoniobacterales bacterium]
MKRAAPGNAFALALTLVLLALIVIVILAYLANARTDRATSSVYANGLRAQMVAESGLAAATKLLSDNTRYGNYITAMPPPAPSPAPLYTEVYRPTDPLGTTQAKADDYLQPTNAAGEILASLAATPSGTPQVDSRPMPMMIPGAGPFTLGDPGFTAGNSYDFNQIVRLGTNANGRLVNPLPTPAYGQWVRLRNSSNELIGRYAFFIEDESMKTNVNVAGNNLAPGSNLRVNDLTLPLPSPTPATQLQEVDPAAVLPPPPTIDRAVADSALTSIGAAGTRLASRSTLALLEQWQTNFSDYSHLVTSASQDDNTTARGWQRLDLNTLVAAAVDNTAKAALAHRLSNWIRDAWTGPALSGLEESQVFANERLRLQLAANIIDYIDQDNSPTDLGDIRPDGFPNPVPVIGIEKIPHLGSIFVVFEASNRSGNTAQMRMKIRLNFLNMFGSMLNLQNTLSKVIVQGVPVILKKGGIVFNHYSDTFSIPITALTPVSTSGGIYDIPPAVDGSAPNGGARSYETVWLVPNETVTFSTQAGLPTFQAGEVQVSVYGLDNERVDITAAQTADTPSTGYTRSGTSPSGDFLLDATPGPRDVSAIFLQEDVVDTTVTRTFGDPRYRPELLDGRWRRLNLTDNHALSDRLDLVDTNPRIYGADWFDYTGDRPLAFFRNGPMLNIGELGNISVSEFPFRTIYLQYPERPAVGGGPTNITQVTTRRRDSVDYILMDLFRTDPNVKRTGGLNINTQQRLAGTQQHTLAPLFLGLPVGTQTITQAPVDMVARFSTTTGNIAYSSIFDRRIAVGTPPDNTPLRPFFQIGELASMLSRLVNSSDTTTTGNPGRTTVLYSAIRNSPGATTEVNANFQRDMGAEQEFREVSNSITTRGNIFRVLYVGQAIKDINGNGIVDANEVKAEYLGEAFVQRNATFQAGGSNLDAVTTVDSTYRILTNRVITE